MTHDAQWQPVPGDEIKEMLDRTGLGPADRDGVLTEATRVLTRCAAPTWGEAASSAELVVGEVQSGKTMSFTALTALARDNGFPLIVILAGTKNNLREQTLERLKRDLAMTGHGGLPAWAPIDNPGTSSISEVASRIESWKSSKVGVYRRTPATTVAVVLKQTTRLRQATDFLAGLIARCGPFPVLVIDDEGDQAGLNVAWRTDEESPTYRSIKALRAAAPSHSYVLYTATPQALLLLQLTDTVSPRTVTVLRRGTDYVGGHDLFVDHRASFVRTIHDLDDALDPDQISPPESLRQAIATFLIALVVSQVRRDPMPLTMLVHPSASTDLHRIYHRWASDILDSIRRPLESGDAIYVQQLRDGLMKPAYDDLATTGGTLVKGEMMSLDEILEILPDYLNETKVRVVNSRDGREISGSDWLGSPGWIVIGGNKLDRGFTVHNLAITYMPRSPGVGNADTVQQRGRFFGYKRSYLDLLRAWLNPETTKVYESYVRHEAAMRSELEALDSSGTSLRTWRRQFLLASNMSPTRAAVVSLDVSSTLMRPGWAFAQSALYAEHTLVSAQPQDQIGHIKTLSEPDQRDKRAGGPRHRVLTVAWEEIAPLLVDWGAVPAERSFLDAIVYALSSQDEPLDVDVVLMDGADPSTPRTRGPRDGSAKAIAAAGGAGGASTTWTRLRSVS